MESDDFEIDTDRLVKRELDNCEHALELRLLGQAEKDLNRAAARFREFGLDNTSPRYHRLSSYAAHLRLDFDYRPETEP